MVKQSKKMSIKKHSKKKYQKRSVKKTVKQSVKRRNKSVKKMHKLPQGTYHMKGMGALLQMYGGATAETEAQYQELKRQKEALDIQFRSISDKKSKEDYKEKMQKIKDEMKATKEKAKYLFKSIGSAVSQASQKISSGIESGLEKAQEAMDIRTIKLAEIAKTRQKKRGQHGSGFHRKKLKIKTTKPENQPILKQIKPPARSPTEISITFPEDAFYSVRK